MFKFFKRRSIKVQLLSLAVFTAAVMIMITFIYYFQVSSDITKSNNQYSTQIFHQVKRSISIQCDRIIRVMNSIVYNDQVQSYLLETDPGLKYTKSKAVDKLFNNMTQLNDGILDIVIVDKKGIRYFEGNSTPKMNAAIKALPDKTNSYFSGMIDADVREQITDCFLVSSTVYSIQDESYMQDIGKVVIILKANVLGLNMDSDTPLGNADFIIKDKNNVVYSTNDPKLDQSIAQKDYSGYVPGSYTVLSGKNKYYVNTADIPEIGGKIVSVVSEEKLFHNLDWIRGLTLTILVFASILLLYPFFLVINNILKPMDKFMRFIASVQTSENLKGNITLEGYKEIEIRAGKFNDLLNKIDNLTVQLVDTNTRLYEAEIEKKESELNYLKSQINPHFLYNTLETMKGCAVEEHAAKTFGMAKALGHIFRYSIKGSDIVTLREELEVIKSYIHIQEIRFSDKLEVNYDFSEETLDHKILKVILQPIVENAISHGLEQKMGKCILIIGGKVDDRGDLLIRVADNGVGMSKETLDEIRSCLSQSAILGKTSSAYKAGIGIANVDRRIKLNFGPAYGLVIQSTPGLGTEVVIKIPTILYDELNPNEGGIPEIYGSKTKKKPSA